MNAIEISRTLEDTGLTPALAKIYLAALELGAGLPTHIARRANIKRPTLYQLLPDLLEKGLISTIVRGKRRYLMASDPEVYLDKRRVEIARLEQLLPQLRALLNTTTVKPIISVHEGVEGLKYVYMDNLKAKKPILEFLGLEKIHPDIENYTTGYYIPERINRRLPIKILISGPTRYGKFNLITDLKSFREVKQIDSKKFPIPLDVYIYGQSVSFIIYRVDSEPVGVIIRSKEIATTMMTLFLLAWENNATKVI